MVQPAASLDENDRLVASAADVVIERLGNLLASHQRTQRKAQLLKRVLERRETR